MHNIYVLMYTILTAGAENAARRTFVRENAMILTIDVGNTNIVLALFGDDGGISAVSRISTDRGRMSDEYAVLLRNIALLHGAELSCVTGAIISSVVPPLTNQLKKAIMTVFGVNALIVGPGLKTGLNIRIDDPSQLGSDLACGAVAAINKYPTPCVIVDLGTATKFTALGKNGVFLGGAILPGVNISLDALSQGAAQLPHISLDGEPKSVIGTNTVDCMRSGVIYGTASMIDGMLDRFREELGGDLTVVATGGLAGDIIPHCRSSMILDSDLLLEGLRILYLKNAK